MSISTILAGVDSFIQSEIQKGETAVETWWTGFEPTAEADLEKFVTVMQGVALALVTGLAQAAVSGQVKFSTASSALLSAAKAQGITASQTMADTLVQQVVQSLSMAKPPVPTPAS